MCIVHRSHSEQLCYKLANMKNRPETAMMSYGYKPFLSEGAVKCPIFMTSTFVFKTAEEGKDFFSMAYGREPSQAREMGLIYSRINNPDIEILEERLKLWDDGEEAAAFSSGMSAISTTLMSFLKPGDCILYSNPLYGGTHSYIHFFLAEWGIESIAFDAADDAASIRENIGDKGSRLKMILVETPANPTNDLIDIRLCADIAASYSTAEKTVLLAVDNTYMGPLWSHPLKHGAHIVLYSATKYIGGHSDVIAGVAVASKPVMAQIKMARTFFGTIIDPHTSWLLLRSLETLKIRMEAAASNAKHVAQWLQQHPLVEKVYYLGFNETALNKRQYSSSGAMVSFDVKGGEAQAFAFLNALQHIRLAVSLGGTESLAEHPFTMTHAGVPVDEKNRLGLTEKMIRLSIGIEHHEDIIRDISNALDAIPVKK
nr:cystathionine gamma-synthase family protein [Pseudoflavitalea sp. G-6-1-2]